MNPKRFKKLHGEFLRSNKDKISQFWGYEINPRWFNRVLSDPIPRYRWFRSVLPDINGLKILDLCGAFGMFGAYLKSVKGYSFEYTCFDKDEPKLDFGPEYFKAFGLKPPRFVLGNIYNPLQFMNDSFDMVWLMGWCAKRVKNNFDGLFKEVNKVLRPKGYFIFNMAFTEYKTRSSREELIDLLENTGFTILRLDKIPNKVDFGVVAHKSTDHLSI